MRVGILASHPIQYQAPWFRALAKQMELEVYFCHNQRPEDQAKAGFGVAFEWDVDVFSGYSNRFLKNIAERCGVDHFSGCDTPEIRQLVANGKFDAFIVNGWNLKSFWQAARECRRVGVPVFVRGDSQLNTPRSFLKRWGKEIVYPWLLRQFDGFLAVGKRNTEYLKYYGVPREKVFFVPHIVDNEWFAFRAKVARARRHETRKEWKVADKSLCALFVGKFIDEKRPADLIRAMDVLRQRGIESIGVFVGAGELEGRLKEEAEKLGVEARFVGFKNQSELPACYASADVLVLPGRETWGLVVNEAMACGTGAVVSDAVGCAADMIEDGKTGFIFPIGNVSALADRLQGTQRVLDNLEAVQRSLLEKTAQYSLQLAVTNTLDALENIVYGGASNSVLSDR